MAKNSIFTKTIVANKSGADSRNINGSSLVSKVRTNREYLISKTTANELNTYVSFDPFPTFNDLFATEYDTKTKKDITDEKKLGPGTAGVRSIFNKAGAVIIGANVKTDSIISAKASAFRISNNVPLMDNPETRIAIRNNSKCTVKDLVEASQQGLLGRETYSYSDFMYCKHLGKMSNSYLITLRRFPYPVDDFISSIGEGDKRADPNLTSKNSESLGCLVTWIGTPGNEINNILKYSVSMPFKPQKAKMQDNPVDADSGGGIANGIAAAFDPTYRQQYMDGMAGKNVNSFFTEIAPNMKNSLGDPPYQASQWNNWKEDSKVYGPIDVIKDIYMRSEDGLGFDQTMTIVFDYELRSYNGINGRQAMLDLLSNILNVTYSTGTFWGGGFRGGGAHQNNIFTNLEIYKKNTRGFAGYVDAFAKDYSNIAGKIGESIDKNGGMLNTLKQLANNLGGMLIASTLNKLGRPQKQLAQSMLSPAPVGFWHLTIGNPHHPIMSIGNMILKKTTIEHYGPLGLDDFPTGIKVTCELDRGKSRDIRDIEKLYMHGNDRIYTSMGPKVFDMYEHSREYREGNGEVSGVSSYSGGNADTDTNNKNAKDMKGDLNAVLKKYFGHSDTYSIKIAAMEQENGSIGKQKKGTAGGDSSVGSKVISNN